METKYEKVVKSAIIVMPPEDLWLQIQEIRKLYDKAYARWMPHINMVYPFIPGENFPEVVETLKDNLSLISPFKISFKDLGYFQHKGSCTLWCNPKTEGNELVQLNSLLENTFPYCKDLSSKSDKGFSPHLTLGQFTSKEIQQKLKEFEDKWQNIEWTCSEVFLICRNGFDDPFKIIFRVPFAGKNVEQVNSPPSKGDNKGNAKGSSSSSSNNFSIFISNIPFKMKKPALEELFQNKGFKPASVTIAQKPGGQSKGFGFVEFVDKSEAQRAIDELNGYAMEGGRALGVQFSKSKSEELKS